MALLLFVLALLPVARFLVGVGEGFRDSALRARRERAEAWAAPLAWSDRHRPVLPCVVGVTSEFLGTHAVTVERKGSRVRVEVELSWWARTPWYERAVATRAAELLREGGVNVTL